MHVDHMSSVLHASSGRVPEPADNSAGPVWNCPRDVNGTVLTSHIGFPQSGHNILPLVRN